MAKIKNPRKDKRQAELDAELKKAEEQAAAANPAETAQDNGQKTNNNAIDNEPVEGTTWKGKNGERVISDNVVTKAGAAAKEIVKKNNPLQWGKDAKEAWDKGEKAKAILEATGLPNTVESFRDAYEIAKNGVVQKPEDSKVYNEKMEEEKQEREENKPAEPVTTAETTTQPATEKTENQALPEEKIDENTAEYDSLMKKVNGFGSVYGDYTKRLPSFMSSAYKNGAFGVPGSKDAKNRLGYFIVNHLGTTLANTLGGIGNAAMANAGKAGTYQASQSDWDKMRETNLGKGLETTWQNEQAKAQDSLNKFGALTGMDIKLYNDRKEQNYFIDQSKRIGKKYADMNEEEKAQLLSGELFKKYQETGDTTALAGASALAELLKTGTKEAIRNGWEEFKAWFNPNK